jgi:hypothetical protein
MVRRHFPNLASPIFDVAPPSTLIQITAKNRQDHGRISEPPTMESSTMESSVSAMLEHHKFPG